MKSNKRVSPRYVPRMDKQSPARGIKIKRIFNLTVDHSKINCSVQTAELSQYYFLVVLHVLCFMSNC